MLRAQLHPALDPHLSVALLVSAVVHAVLLVGVVLLNLQPEPESGPILRMVEYRPHPAEDTPGPTPEARAASASQRAAGRSRLDQEATAPEARRSPSPTLPPVPVPARKQEGQGQTTHDEATAEGEQSATQDRVLTTDRSAAKTATARPEPRAEGAAQPAAPGRFRLFPSDRQLARWDRKRRRRRVAEAEQRAKKAREATREDRAAAYISGWLSKVERIGNLNYPEEARERDITGRVRVEALVRPDGSLGGVRVLESSGHEILDAAAKQIIRMGAPYMPLAGDLQRRYAEGLPIRHYFNFTRGGEMEPPGEG